MRHLLSALCVVLSLATACAPERPPAPPPAAVTVTLDPALAAPVSDSGRPIDRLSGSGAVTDVISNELLISSTDSAAIDAAAARLGGQVFWSVDVGATHFATITFDAASQPTDTLQADLSALSAGKSGTVSVGSPRARGLLAAAAAEQRRGAVKVGLNFILQPQGIAEGTTAEANTDDAFTYPTWGVRADATDYGIGKAWQVLARAGRLNNKVNVVVNDSGFLHHADLPLNTVVVPADAFGKPNTWQCSDHDCLWHGTLSSSVLAGQADNHFGAAGTAGPVVGQLTLLRSGDNDVGSMMQYVGQLMAVASNRPRVINMSGGEAVSEFLGFASWVLDDYFLGLRENGTLVFASAGNQGIDVDDGAGGFESQMYLPCEAHGVVCVGGLEPDADHPGALLRADHSNFGSNAPPAINDGKDDSVDLYGPFTVTSLKTPDTAGAIDLAGTSAPQRGTSFSSPFVAGVAALIWAADPTLSARQVEGLLKDTATRRLLPGEPYPVFQVNAYAAVKQIVGNLKPTITITAPAAVDTGSPGLPGVALTAAIADWEDATGALTVQWSSSDEGPITTGASSSYVFKSLGKRQITARVTDSSGAYAEATVQLTIVPTAPTFTITSPNPPIQQVDKPVQLAVSLDNQFASASCRWRSTDPADGVLYTLGGLQGCVATATFTTLGTHHLSVEVDDEYGQTATQQLQLQIVSSVLSATITAPSPMGQDSAHLGDVVVLSANLTASTSVTKRWSFQSNDPSCPAVPLTVTSPSVTLPGAYSVLWNTTGADLLPNGCGVGVGRIQLSITDGFNQTAAANPVAFFLAAPVVIP